MKNNVKDQLVTDEYAIYNGDCMSVMPTLEDESIDLSVYSPPFAGLYNYSSHENDFSNSRNLVAGIVGTKKIDPERLKDIDFVDLSDTSTRS